MPASPDSTVICSTPAIAATCRSFDARASTSGEISDEPEGSEQGEDAAKDACQHVGHGRNRRTAFPQRCKNERERGERGVAAQDARCEEQAQFIGATEAARH